MEKTNFKRLLCLVLSLAMIFALVSFPAYAEETEDAAETVIEEATEETAAEADESAYAEEVIIEEAETEEALEEAEPESEVASEEATQTAAEAVQAQIDALPAVEEVAEMDLDGQNEVYTAFLAACEAYDALSEEEQADIDDSALDDLADYFNGSMTTMATGTALTSSGGSLSSGDYYLDGDLALTDAITIPNGVTVTIDLNGHTLTGVGGSTKTIYVNGGALTLEDSVGTGKITTAESFTANCGAVYVDSGGTFTMNGGSISDITSSRNGAAVYVSGLSSQATFTMNGGTISGNSGGSGSAVYLQSMATFTMNGGTITENSGKYPVYINNNLANSFEMNGGTICIV